MTRPLQDSLVLGGVIVALPWAAAVLFGVLDKPALRKMARISGWAAIALVFGYLCLDCYVGFGNMSAFYFGIAGAVAVGLLVAWAVNRPG